MRRLLAWWGLFLLGVLLVVMGVQGSAGRVLAALLTPGRLEAQE